MRWGHGDWWWLLAVPLLGIAAFVFLGAFFAVGLISYRVFRGV